jgi:hypothetical protein
MPLNSIVKLGKVIIFLDLQWDLGEDGEGRTYEMHRKPGRCCLSSPQRHPRPGHEMRSRSSPTLLSFNDLSFRAHINMSDRYAKRMYSRKFGVLVPEWLVVVVELILFETMFLKGQLSKDPGQCADWLHGMQG